MCTGITALHASPPGSTPLPVKGSGRPQGDFLPPSPPPVQNGQDFLGAVPSPFQTHPDPCRGPAALAGILPSCPPGSWGRHCEPALTCRPCWARSERYTERGEPSAHSALTEVSGTGSPHTVLGSPACVSLWSSCHSALFSPWSLSVPPDHHCLSAGGHAPT